MTKWTNFLMKRNYISGAIMAGKYIVEQVVSVIYGWYLMRAFYRERFG